MKTLGIMVALLLAFTGGAFLQSQFGGHGVLFPATSMDADRANESGEPEPLYWVAPMDKNYRRDKPGKSPMGMDLIPVYEEDLQGSGEEGVRISPTVVNNLGVRIARVERGALEMPILTVGYVAFDGDSLQHIHSRVDGWIEVLSVASSGDSVTKGQTLYELYSPALVSAQEEYLAALRSGNAILKNASRARLVALGLSAQQVDRLEKRRTVEQRIRVVADQNGYVETLNVRQGMFIKPATEVLSIGALESVWVIGEVLERQSSWIKPGQAVEIRSAAYPGRVWEGTVDYLYPVLDRQTRTLRFRVEIDNRDLSLRPNLFVDLKISALVDPDALTIPRQALIKAASHSRVVRRNDDGSFQSVIVKTGVEAGDRVQITEGLDEGSKVVTSAQFLIDSESNIEAELARMEGGDAEPEMPDNRVITTGKLNAIMTDMGMLSITHDPIPEWEWPVMKMDFMVSEDVSLEDLKPGQNIRFELEKQGDWDYVITRIFNQENP